MASQSNLKTYRQKRSFSATTEPSGRDHEKRSGAPIFVIQKHAASQLHYDFRLEVDGVLKSWAVPKGPSLDPRVKRLARETEDHPIEYADFEGQIPEGEYGAGSVEIWDRGTYESATEQDGEPIPMNKAVNSGHVVVDLHGQKLKGQFALTRFQKKEAPENWLLVKVDDHDADARRNPTSTESESVVSGRDIDEIARDAKARKSPVQFSNTDKLYFPQSKITKGRFLEYYLNIAETILPYLKDRPLSLHRFPEGIAEEGFFQKDAPDYFPKWILTQTLPKEDGSVRHVICDNPETLAYLANQGCITPHIWLSRRDKPHYPDQIVFDLDPSEQNSFKDVRETAFALRDLMRGIDLRPRVKTSGSRGLHLVNPLRRTADFNEVRALAQAIAEQLAQRHPELVTVAARKQKRGDRVFVDTGRNAYAQTIAPAYSVRPKEGAPVSAPITWKELEDDTSLHPQTFTIENMQQRLEDVGDLWSGMMRHGQSVRTAMHKLKKLDAS